MEFAQRLRTGAMRPHGRPAVGRVLPNLLIGGYPAPDDAAWLHVVHGVTAVVSLQDNADLAAKYLVLAELTRAYRINRLRFRRVPVADGDTDALGAHLDRVVRLLHQLLRRGERVYVHCNAGLNRAPTMAIAYLHVHRGMSLATARDFVKQRQHCVPYMRLLDAHYARRHSSRQPRAAAR